MFLDALREWCFWSLGSGLLELLPTVDPVAHEGSCTRGLCEMSLHAQFFDRGGLNAEDSAAKATLLQGLDIPTTGGQTRFCNTLSAYEDLPKAFKSELYGKSAVHKYDTDRAVARPKNLSSIEVSETPDVIHPLVRTHDETGNQAIYYNSNRTDSVVGMRTEESDALLDKLGEHITHN